MRGFSIPSTKQDVINNLVIAPDETKQYLKLLVDNRFVWWTVKKLYNAGDTYLDEDNVEQTYTEDETYIEDDTHRILISEDMDGNSTERYAQEWIEDPNWFASKRLGLSYQECMEIIGE